MSGGLLDGNPWLLALVVAAGALAVAFPLGVIAVCWCTRDTKPAKRVSKKQKRKMKEAAVGNYGTGEAASAPPPDNPSWMFWKKSSTTPKREKALARLPTTAAPAPERSPSTMTGVSVVESVPFRETSQFTLGLGDHTTTALDEIAELQKQVKPKGSAFDEPDPLQLSIRSASMTAVTGAGKVSDPSRPHRDSPAHKKKHVT